MNFWLPPRKNLTAIGELNRVIPIKIISDTAESCDKILEAYRTVYRLSGLMVMKIDNWVVKLSANSSVFNTLFKTTFIKFDDGTYGCISPPYIPEPLVKHIVAICGLETYSLFKNYVQVRVPKVPSKIDIPLNSFTTPTEKYKGLTGKQMASLYKFPMVSNPGLGTRIGIVSLGGNFSQPELTTYFKKHNINPVPTIQILNLPGCDLASVSASQETALDVQIISTICNHATISVYNGANNFNGFYDALKKACSESDCVSVSWGIRERYVPYGTLDAFENLISSVKIPVFIASGDDGSDNKNVSFPACCPSAISCGGTTVTFDSKSNPMSLATEITWPGSGGGYSRYFNKKDYQPMIPGKQNGIPDVCANADPKCGYRILFNENEELIGGTSAVAPLMASFFALCKQSNVSFYDKKSLKNRIYDLQNKYPVCFKDITIGNNGEYRALKNWDPCTGLGRLNFSECLNYLSSAGAKSTGATATSPNLPVNLKNSSGKSPTSKNFLVIDNEAIAGNGSCWYFGTLTDRQSLITEKILDIDPPLDIVKNDGPEIDLPPPLSKIDLPPPLGKIDLPPPLGRIDLPPALGKLDLQQPSSKNEIPKVDLPPPPSKVDLPPPLGKIDLPPPPSKVDLPPPPSKVDLPPPIGKIDFPQPSSKNEIPKIDLPQPPSKIEATPPVNLHQNNSKKEKQKINKISTGSETPGKRSNAFIFTKRKK